jgi:16S rRNA (guanine966-N2)-methyltransferase
MNWRSSSTELRIQAHNPQILYMSSPRIISGKARGFRLQDVPGDITRPITDRVKEALFNIIGSDMPGAIFLDLFAGTGSVGIEALSRGAEFVRFTDINWPAVKVVKANLEHTRLNENAEVIRIDAFQFLKQNPDRDFDYIYIAPPQYHEMWIKALALLDANAAWLSLEGWIIVQIDPVEYQPQSLLHFHEFDQRRYGSTLLIFYERLSQDHL